MPFELTAHAHTAFNESNSNDTEYCQIRANGGAGDKPHNYTAVCQVMMQAHFLGKTHVDCYVSYIDGNYSAGAFDYQDGLKTFCTFSDSHYTSADEIVLRNYPVSVVNGNKILQTIFVVVLTVLIVVANALMGCELNLDIVRDTLRRPIAPAIGLACQFVLMPLVSVSRAPLAHIAHCSCRMELHAHCSRPSARTQSHSACSRPAVRPAVARLTSGRYCCVAMPICL